MDETHTTKSIIEALLFASSAPLSLKKMKSILDEKVEIGNKELRGEIKALANEYEEQNRAFEIKEIADGYLLQSKQEFESYLQKLYPTKAVKLAPSALEVLAIIAYRQPITRAEIENIRGVDCTYSLSQLLDRDLVSNQKKLDAPGTPALFETNTAFLEYFGLKNLKELPPLAEAENEAVSSK